MGANEAPAFKRLTRTRNHFPQAIDERADTGPVRFTILSQAKDRTDGRIER